MVFSNLLITLIFRMRSAKVWPYKACVAILMVWIGINMRNLIIFKQRKLKNQRLLDSDLLRLAR